MEIGIFSLGGLPPEKFPTITCSRTSEMPFAKRSRKGFFVIDLDGKYGPIPCGKARGHAFHALHN